MLFRSNEADAEGVQAENYYHWLAQKMTRGLSAFSAEGYVYRVDLRLRPEGNSGNVVQSIDRFERYYQTRIGAWERLALLKAWPVAGSVKLGQRYLAMSRPFICEPAFDERALADVREMKSQIDDKVQARGQTGRNVKLGRGGIREIELIVQTLQVTHGRQIPSLLVRSTLPALTLLRDHSLIPADDAEALRTAYLFLRDVENKLQMVDDAQTHSLPEDQESLTVCARLLGYVAAEELIRDLRQHTDRVSGVFTRIVFR